jgi:hypothetical protein
MNGGVACASVGVRGERYGFWTCWNAPSGSCPRAWCSWRRGRHVRRHGPGWSAGRCLEADEGIIAHGRDGFRCHVARPLHGPFIVLLKQDGADPRRVMASSLGKMPTTSVRRLISPITRSSGWSSATLPGAGQGRSCRPARRSRPRPSAHSQLGHLGPDLVGNEAPRPLGGFGAVLGKGSGDEGRDDAPTLAAGMGEYT